MTIKLYCEIINERFNKRIDYKDEYIRTEIYNSHTLCLSDELKEARLELLFQYDKLFGTPIEYRSY